MPAHLISAWVDEETYNRLIKVKGQRSWREFLLDVAKENTINVSGNWITTS